MPETLEIQRNEFPVNQTPGKEEALHKLLDPPVFLSAHIVGEHLGVVGGVLRGLHPCGLLGQRLRLADDKGRMLAAF